MRHARSVMRIGAHPFINVTPVCVRSQFCQFTQTAAAWEFPARESVRECVCSKPNICVCLTLTGVLTWRVCARTRELAFRQLRWCWCGYWVCWCVFPSILHDDYPASISGVCVCRDTRSVFYRICGHMRVFWLLCQINFSQLNNIGSINVFWHTGSLLGKKLKFQYIWETLKQTECTVRSFSPLCWSLSDLQLIYNKNK